MDREMKLKRAVVKEEYVAITGDFQKAVILNQFIYWSERVSDFDEFIKQENKRAEQHGFEQQEATNGWIYKTAEDLSTETMLGLSPASMRNHIKALVDLGYISERNNPKYKWDKTKQYRVNLAKIVEELNKAGYVLEGYKFDFRNLETERSFLETKTHNFETKTQNERNKTAIPETTTEITTETTVVKKERKKETSYDEILSVVEDESLKATYYEYIKMRKLIKSPMTDRALELLINKVNKLEPNDISRKIKLLETAIERNWKTVYPSKDEIPNNSRGYQSIPNKKMIYGREFTLKNGVYCAEIDGHEHIYKDGRICITVNGTEYIYEKGKHYLAKNGMGIPVDPWAEDDLDFLK